MGAVLANQPRSGPTRSPKEGAIRRHSPPGVGGETGRMTRSRMAVWIIPVPPASRRFGRERPGEHESSPRVAGQVAVVLIIVFTEAPSNRASSKIEMPTEDPRSIGASASVVEAARLMREGHIGSLPITDEEQLVGMITDRDITTRVVAEAADPKMTSVGDVFSGTSSVLSPTRTSKRRSNSWPATKFDGCPLSRTAGLSASLPRPTSRSARTRRRPVSSSWRSLSPQRESAGSVAGQHFR